MTLPVGWSRHTERWMWMFLIVAGLWDLCLFAMLINGWSQPLY